MNKRKAIARAVLEELERRRLLAGVVINEFLANNNSGIVDQDNDHSDWIEIRNTDATSVNLSGWSLTDDAANLTKWQFPSTTVAAGGYLVVYASGKNRAVSGQQLHTNFLLDGDNGEYLALVKPGGTIIADSYNPFPPQEPDVSYGRGSTSSATDTLVGEAASVKAKVPTAATSIDATWRNLNFTPDGTWLSNSAGVGVGYDTNTSGTDYTPYIDVNVQSQMFNFTPSRTSVYIRVPFDVADPSVLNSLHLKMQYDDGFVAYLNGTEVGTNGNARRAFSTSSTPAWNSIANANRDDDAATVHEDIDISASLGLLVPGNNVLAIHGLNVANSSDLLISPLLTADRSLAASQNFMINPTPGAANSTGTLGFVADTNFSVDRGFFTSPFNVAITTATAGATIRYTLDGTKPTATTGSIYSSPINISTTKTLRAAAFKTGWTPTDVDTQTYIFLANVLTQSGSGLPTSGWGHTGQPDWSMDSLIVSSYSGTITNDMKSVPSMSLVMPFNDWFGSGGVGIYPSGSGVEKATSVEMISTNANDQFQTDAAVEVQGASQTVRWNSDKLSFRLTFKAPYGPTKLDHAVFTDPVLDKNAATKFDKLILDSVNDDSWMSPSSTDRTRAKFIQDQYAGDLQNLSGGFGPHGKYIHLYLNGLYWGLYYLHEEPDDSFASEYLGGDREDYDVVKHTKSTVVAGGSGATTHFNEMLSAVNSAASNWNGVLAKLDVDGFIDYMIINHYIGSTDWSSHNWYASFNRVDPNGRWRFHNWDAEITLRDVNTDNSQFNETDAPTGIHVKLMASSEYKQKFNDRVQKLLRDNGLLTTAGSIYQMRVNQVNAAMVGESARWGDNHSGSRFTRDNWRATQDALQVNYFPTNKRGANVLTQYGARGWLLSLAAPTYSQYGGTINPGYQLTLSKPSGSPGTAVIYYTLDGSDPRLTGGAVSSSAVQYTGPITLNVSKRVKARIKDGSNWSAVVDQTFLTPNLFPLRITELHYHPANHSGVVDPDDMEFIELLNTGTSSINLQNCQITGAIDTYTFGSYTLAAGARVCLAHKPTTFSTVYPGAPQVSPGYSGKLDNAGEAITLLGPLGETLQTFTYGDSAPWPTTPDGDGPSLEITNALGDPNDPANWHASLVNEGTPGTAALPPVVMSSAFLYNTAHSISVTFDHDMDQTTFAVADIDVQLQPGGAVFHPTSVTFTSSKTANFVFAAPLADGNYTATLLSGSVKDAGGAATQNAHVVTFFALNGDANHDRQVNTADQTILTAHLNQAGTFQDGDFDLNGTVNSADQTILNNAWHLWLPAQGAVALPVTSGNDVYRIRRESATLAQIFAGSDSTATYRLMLAPVTSLSFIGGVGNDSFTYDLSNGSPLGSLAMTFDGGNSGTDSLKILGSTGSESVTFTSTTVTAGSTVITYAGAESRLFDGAGGGDNLAINSGSIALTAAQAFTSLSVSAGATLDIANFRFSINYNPGNSPFSTINGLIQNANHQGAWDLPGITTSRVDAKAPSLLTTLAVSEATGAVNFNSQATALWRGQVIDQTTVLVAYTFTGDANMNGVMDSDDYFHIDSHVNVPSSSGYANGDFNYDGLINGDDYFRLDKNFNKNPSLLLGAVLESEGGETQQAAVMRFEYLADTSMTADDQKRDPDAKEEPSLDELAGL